MAALAPRRGALGFAALALAALGSGLAAQAQTAATAPQVNPGLINNQNQQNREQIEQQNRLPQEPEVAPAPRAAPQIAIPGGPTFKLAGVVFDNPHFLSRPEIEAITSKYVGTEVDIARVQKMTQEINDLYAAKGIVTAAAYLPKQDVKDGVIEIRFVEGRLEKMTVTGADALAPNFVLSHVDQKPGDLVDLPRITDELAAFNKTGVARIQAQLEPGSQFGLTDVELAVTEPARNLAQAFIDNQGVSSVGSFEGGFLYQRYAPLGVDDKLTIYAVKSGGDINGNIGYNVPVGPWDGRIGLSFTRGAIRVISGPYTSLGVRGESEAGSVNFSQPIFANPDWLVMFIASVSKNISSSDQSFVRIIGNHTTLETGGFTLGYTESRFSGTISPTISHAGSRSDIAHRDTDFLLQSGTYNASAQLPYNVTATLGGAWQVSSKDVLPGDQLFQLGGPTTVRGYTPDVVAGHSGYYGNFELHHTLPVWDNGVDAFAFYDHGSVYNHYPAVQTLDSLGLGLSWTVATYLVADVSAGFPLDRVVNTQPGYEIYFRLTAKVDDR
jgi:hemolysin activation/secretion protein